jgi:hypothetical protein
MTRSTLALLTAALLYMPAPARAQQPAPFPQRFLAIGGVTYFEATSLNAGFLWQHALHRPREVVTPLGNTEVTNPRLYLHVLATAGGRILGDDGGGAFRAFGQVGIARRNDSAKLTTSALVAQAALTPRAFGPAARVEVMDNIGVQAGWLFARGGGNGVFISVDYMSGLFCDLNLAPGCR